MEVGSEARKIPQGMENVLQALCGGYMGHLFSDGSLCHHLFRDEVTEDLEISHTILFFVIFPTFWEFQHQGILWHLQILGNAAIGRL